MAAQSSIDISQIAKTLIQELEGSVHDTQMKLEGIVLFHERIAKAIKSAEESSSEISEGRQ